MGRPPTVGRSASPKTRPLNAPLPPPAPSQQKLPLTDFIHRQLVSMAEHERQRSRLVNVLIIALALLVASTAPGYFFKGFPIFSTGLLVRALLIFVAAFAANSWFRRPTVGAYLLVVGGGATLAAQMVVLAFAHHAVEVAHASLLLPAIILVAGLLFVPEVTLIAAFGSTA